MCVEAGVMKRDKGVVGWVVGGGAQKVKRTFWITPKCSHYVSQT